MATNTQRIAALEKAVVGINTSIQSLTASITNLKTEIDSIKNALTALPMIQFRQDALDQTITSLNGNVANLNTRLDSLTDSVDILYAKVSMLESIAHSHEPEPDPEPRQKPGPDGPGVSVGVPAGVSLTPSGGVTVTEPGAVLNALDITGTVTVAAPNVVIKNSKIHGTGSELYGVKVQSGDVTIMDSEIYGFTSAGIMHDNWKAYRVDIHSMRADGVKLGSNTVLEDSYIHDFTPVADGHEDGAQLQKGSTNVVVRNNTINNTATGVEPTTSAIILKNDLGPDTVGPILVEGNYLDGGSYTLYARSAAYNMSGVVIRNNVFGGNSRYGHVSIDIPVIFEGNQDASGAIITLPNSQPEPEPEPVEPSWPGPTNTGVPQGTVLSTDGLPAPSAQNEILLTVANAVYDSKLFDRSVRVLAPNVTIKNSVIRGPLTVAWANEPANSSLTILDSEITGEYIFPVCDPSRWDDRTKKSGITGRNIVGERLNIHDFGKGIMTGGNVTIRDSWIHDFSVGYCDANNAPTHGDGVFVNASSNNHLTGNFIDSASAAPESGFANTWNFMTAAIFLHRGDVEAHTNDTFIGNRLTGGAYTVYAGDRMAQNVVWQDNVFVRDSTYTKGGTFGPVTGNTTNVTWTNNTWEDTGQPV